MTYTTYDLFKIVKELQHALQHLNAAENMIGSNKGYHKMVSQLSNYILDFNAMYGEACANDAIDERRRQYEAENRVEQ